MEIFTDDTVVALASFLSPHDMVSLALTCKRFGDKYGTDKKQSASREEDTREVRQKEVSREVGNIISLMEVAARTALFALATEDEKNALPRRGDESWIGLYQEFLVVFRLPLQFDKLVGNIDYVRRSGKTRVCSLAGSAEFSSAICSNIMRSGKHYFSLQVNEDPTTNLGILLGIMRPTTKDITDLTSCHPANDDLSMFSLKEYETLHHNNNIDCCLFNTNMGIGMIRRRWKKWEESALAALDEEEATRKHLWNFVQPFNWEGMEETHDASFKIGMVLDLDEGTLDVYKNDRRLGTMRSGLVGEYCWVASLLSFNDNVSITIGR